MIKTPLRNIQMAPNGQISKSFDLHGQIILYVFYIFLPSYKHYNQKGPPYCMYYTKALLAFLQLTVAAHPHLFFYTIPNVPLDLKKSILSYVISQLQAMASQVSQFYVKGRSIYQWRGKIQYFSRLSIQNMLQKKESSTKQKL